nr:serine/threonine protein kinase [Gemmatimonadota bacterium]
NQACAGDGELQAEVERWLRSCERADGFLEQPAAEFAAGLIVEADNETGGAAPERIGPYRILHEAGHGGMGAVYLAERADDQFRQRVALKLVRGGLHSEYLVRRFREERQILASLDHPNIARLLDGGVTAEGLPFFAMEFVEGTPIDRFSDEKQLSVEQRLELFLKVCGAVQYAHRNLVVHRDLKPSNILVTHEGEPKLLDFGIAKLLSRDPEAALTQAGMRMLTPEYASPEQIRGEPVNTASDVYSLGVLLYELLAGTPPHRRGTRTSRELEQRVLEREPERPSVAVLRAEVPEQVSRARGAVPSKLSRHLRGDLDTVVLKAMHREPQRRYATAEQFAADVRRHLDGMPVGARPDTPAYRVRKFVQRHRWGVAGAAAFVLLLLGFSTVTAVQAARIREDARRIAVERDRAQQGEAFLLGLFAQSDPFQGRGNAVSVRELLDTGVSKLSEEMANRPEIRARMFLAIGRAYYGLGESDRAILLMDSSYTLLRTLHGETDPVATAAANQLANVLRSAGRYDVAANLYQRILAARRQQYGNQSPEVARSLNGLALVLLMQGRSVEAEALLRDALVIDRKDAAEEPAHLAQTLNNLGHVLRDQGKMAAAEAAHRESLSGRRAQWGPEHFEVSVSLSNLAGVLRDRGDYIGADTLYRHALDLRRRLVGETHPDLAYDRAGYALLLHRRGELQASERVYRQALEVQLRALPSGHPLTATTLTRLGRLLLDMNRPGDARPLLEEAIATRRQVLVPGHWQIAEAEHALNAARTLCARGAAC